MAEVDSRISLQPIAKTDSIAKVALIIGASRGLGLALAQALARNHWHLVLDARGGAALARVLAELEELTHVMAIPGDVADPNHRPAMKDAVRAMGGLDLLVNNASFLGPSSQPDLLRYPIDVLEQVFRVNAIAPLALAQTLREEFRNGARVINISSDAAVEAYEGWGGYGSSKAALEQMSAILAKENPSIRVYWVDPGNMRTQMQQEAYPGEDISDRPPPEASVPGLMALIEGDYASGRYQARDLSKVPSGLTDISGKDARLGAL